MHSVKTLVAILVMSLLVTTSIATTAGATGGEHSGAAFGCVKQIDRRVKDLDKMIAKVESAPDVAPAHRASLVAALSEAKAGLLALRDEVVGLSATMLTPQHEGSWSGEALSPEAAATCKRMFTDYRVYVLRKAQVHLVIAADRVAAQRALLDLLAAELEAAIAASAGHPNAAEAQRLLDDYRARIDAAWLAAAGLGDAVVGLTPADWNANPSVLKPYVEAMRQVKNDLKVARKDARKIIELLGDATVTPAKSSS